MSWSVARRPPSPAVSACDAFGAISCVASCGGESAGAFGASAAHATPARGADASLIVARDPSGATDLTLAVTLRCAPGEGQAELLDFIAALAAAATAI